MLRFVQSGWPSVVEDPVLKPYHSRRNELSIVQGLLMWGIRVIVPVAIRKQILSSLHECHMGIVKMKSMARQYVWWPNIDSDIEHLCKSCQVCCENRDSPASAPLHPWSYPERPWQRLHVDLAGPFMDKMWLVLTDAHSKWPEIFCLNQNSTSSSVINRIREVIVRFGIPEQIVSDNGRQFTSQEFQRFCKNNGIKHTMSSVYHPRSNGAAERLVKTFKRALAQSSGDLDRRLQQFLFQYRITPHSTTGVAPCELLIGRRLRSRMDLIRPDERTNVAQSQDRQQQSYNVRVRPRDFAVGDEVWVKTFSKGEAKWSFGIIQKQIGPVTFLIKVNDQVMKRHVDHVIRAEKKEVQPRPTSHHPSIPIPIPEEESVPETVPVPDDPVPEEDQPEDLNDDSNSSMSSEVRRSGRSRKQTVLYQHSAVQSKRGGM